MTRLDVAQLVTRVARDVVTPATPTMRRRDVSRTA
jgi:hypothetical protein